NLTGVFTFNLALAPKRLEILRELVPTSTTFAFLTNPTSSKFSEAETKEIEAGARALGVQLIILNARNKDELDPAFEKAAEARVGGLVVGSEVLFITTAPLEVVDLAAHRLARCRLLALSPHFSLAAVRRRDLDVRYQGFVSRASPVHTAMRNCTRDEGGPF